MTEKMLQIGSGLRARPMPMNVISVSSEQKQTDAAVPRGPPQ